MKTSTHEFAEVIQTLAGYLEFIQEHCAYYDDVLFRGQIEDKPLLPKLARLRLLGDLWHSPKPLDIFHSAV